MSEGESRRVCWSSEPPISPKQRDVHQGNIRRLIPDSNRRPPAPKPGALTWATERKRLSMPDVMAAGGWRDRRSLEDCYMQADEATMYEVMAEPNKLREVR